MVQTRYRRDDGTIARARQLRRDATPAEEKLWAVLRGSGLEGFKFRRQQRLAGFYGDFVCHSARLIVEVDGDTHASEVAELRDGQRTLRLSRAGYRVTRFTNAEVIRNVEGVAEAIRAELIHGPSPSHSASPSGPLPLPHRGEGN